MSHFAPIAALLATFALTSGAQAAEPTFRFASIDGGSYDTADWRGHPVLVVNTASLCGFTPQYDALQDLSDTYAARGLVVLAVPSNDFNQELADGAAVKQFCDINFDLTLPMTEITHVTGPQAHDFYLWLNASHGFAPGWNFNKALIGPDGALVATWGAATKPTASAITTQIEALLP
ncbi:MAG: glutathione peroxidase [Paracoccaceae bacterium]